MNNTVPIAVPTCFQEKLVNSVTKEEPIFKGVAIVFEGEIMQKLSSNSSS